MQTPLHELHRRLEAKMASFAGWQLPLRYRGIREEHLHTRSHAALFDVCHMGQIRVQGPGASRALETLLPADLKGCAPGTVRYTFFTSETGGILDDLLALCLDKDSWLLVVNAARTEADIAFLKSRLPAQLKPQHLADEALLALQGPAAAAAMQSLCPGSEKLYFMQLRLLHTAGVPCLVSRSGYTGEDGFEISLPGCHAVAVAEALLAAPGILPAGLGARDSLRLEAGLCLHGQDISESTTPVEAALEWSIPAVRRPGGERAGGFPGEAVIFQQLQAGSERRRTGLRPQGQAPLRSGTKLWDKSGLAGEISSGGFSPSLGGPVAMGYVNTACRQETRPLWAQLRGRKIPVQLTPINAVPLNYRR